MAVHRNIENLSIRIVPQDDSYSARTILSDNLLNWDPGAQPEQTTLGDTPAINGEVPSMTRRNYSRTGSVTVLVGSSDEAYIDTLCQNAVECNITVIDDSSRNYGKETTGSRVFFEEPEDPYDGTSRDFIVKMGKYTKKRV